MAEIFPSISPYSYAVNNPVLFTDRYGLHAESSQNMAICPTCPKDEKYDDYRNSKDLFTYDKKTSIVVNGDGIGVTITAQKTQPTTHPFELPWQTEIPFGAFGAVEYQLGRNIEKLSKWEGTFRYGGSSNVFKQSEIDARAIFRQPLIKNRPVNILLGYTLPRNLALKVAKGLKGIGYLTFAVGILDAGEKTLNGNITLEHALTTVGVGALGFVVGTLGAPVVLAVIAVGIVYAAYEDDIWHDYDKKNATNFKEPEK